MAGTVGKLPEGWQTEAPTMRDERKMGSLFEDVIGQPRAVAVLRASATGPVHAYLLLGPAGTGKRAAATSFAAALLCPTSGEHGAAGDGYATGVGGHAVAGSEHHTAGTEQFGGAGAGEGADGEGAPTIDPLCDSCRRVLSGFHPDVLHVQREGASIGIDVARDVTRAAFLSPVEGARKVIVLHDFHLVRDTGPALLKTIEEPPPSTVFIILAEHLPPDLVTIASRCVTVDFDVLRPADVIATLVAAGVEAARAQQLAVAADGRLDRARLLAADPQFEVRQRSWASVPAQLDGTGATAARLAAEVIALMDESVGPLKERQETEMADQIGRNRATAEVTGTKKVRSAKAALNVGIAEIEERHRREQRRQRTDELRAGLAVLAASYRAVLASGNNADARLAVEAVARLDATVRSLEFNPNETILLQALFARLGRLALVVRS